MGCDLADLFEVKLGRGGTQREVRIETGPEEWRATGRHADTERLVVLRAPDAAVSAGAIAWRAVVPPQGEWTASLEVCCG